MAIRDLPPPGPAPIFDPATLSIVTFVTLAFVVIDYLQVPWVLIPFGLFVLFVAPGYAAVALLFGRRSIPSLAMNVALIVGLAVVINVALGTLLLVFAIGPVAPIVGLCDAGISTAATVVQLLRPQPVGSAHGGGWFRGLFVLAGFTRGQRVAAYALFAGILLTFAAIGYLSTLQPGNAPDLSFGVVGVDGTTSTLPTSGTVNTTLAVLVEVRNNATVQPFILSVSSALVGSNATNFSSTPWVMPLDLGPNVTSSEPLNLTSGQSDDVDVSFEFSTGGDYVVSFSLTPPQSHVAVRTNALTIRVT